METDYKKLEEKFKKAPVEVQEALTSVELAESVQAIGNKNGVLLDQEQALFDLVANVLLGIIPSTEFIGRLEKEAHVNSPTASNIAKEINLAVFSRIRSLMQEHATRQEPTPIHTSIEQQVQSDFGPLDLRGNGAQEAPSRDSLKKDMETLGGITIHDTLHEETRDEEAQHHTAPIAHHVEPPKNLPGEKEVVGMTDIHTDALVDHLLGKVASAIQEQIATKSPAHPSQTSSSDPYREPLG